MPNKEEKITGGATLQLHFPSTKSAKAAYDALLAEADFSHRGGSSVKLDGKSVKVEINADDPVSLRASLNSYLRLMHIIKAIDEDTNKE
ncbi:Transcription factor Pcc1 [uncultured archaeon]|nr:Transcription factor Pcc1 [uncultured archaeon]